MSNRNDIILSFSCAHFPCQHRDTIAFLKACNKEYQPSRVINCGDLVDNHALSFHDSCPDLDSAGKELNKAIGMMVPLYELFPIMDSVHSNHSSMLYRKALVAGIPRAMLKDYREFLQAPKLWKWHLDLTIEFRNREKCYFNHGMKSANPTLLAQRNGYSNVQGHHHHNLSVDYIRSPDLTRRYFAASVGSLADWHSLAMAYGRENLKKPNLGCLLIVDGKPFVIPMDLNKKGRWDRKLIHISG